MIPSGGRERLSGVGMARKRNRRRVWPRCRRMGIRGRSGRRGNWGSFRSLFWEGWVKHARGNEKADEFVLLKTGQAIVIRPAALSIPTKIGGGGEVKEGYRAAERSRTT